MATSKTAVQTALPEVDASTVKGLAVMRKIHQLREQVTEVETSQMKSGGMNYSYLSENKLTNAVKPKMQELGLVALPVKSESHTETYNMGEKDGVARHVLLTENHSEFIVMDLDTGDSITVSVEGSGADTMDKGTNKASTCVVKNFYKALLNLPSPEREDPDNTASPQYGGKKTYSASDAGSIQLKYGAHAGKTLRELFDENPEEVEKLANGNSKWIAEKAQAFLNSLSA